MRFKPVILSGGSGTRLWPSSRASLPKQFINFSNNENLFYKTLKRFRKLTDKNTVLIISSRQHGFLCRNEVQKLNIPTEYILEETGRNTAAAVFFSALFVFTISSFCVITVNLIACVLYFCERQNYGQEPVKSGHNIVVVKYDIDLTISYPESMSQLYPT